MFSDTHPPSSGGLFASQAQPATKDRGKLLGEVAGLRMDIEDEARRLARQMLGSSGSLRNSFFQQAGFRSFQISFGESANWFLAHGIVNYLVQGYVTASNGFASVVYRVTMYDAYDWNPNDTRSFEEFSAPVLHGLHTAGLAAQYILYGISSERTTTL